MYCHYPAYHIRNVFIIDSGHGHAPHPGSSLSALLPEHDGVTKNEFKGYHQEETELQHHYQVEDAPGEEAVQVAFPRPLQMGQNVHDNGLRHDEDPDSGNDDADPRRGGNDVISTDEENEYYE